MEAPVVVVSTQVEELEELVTHKLVPLVIPKIGVGTKVNLIAIIAHAFKIFRIPSIILKDTLVVERPWFEFVLFVELVEFKFVPLAKLVNTTSEKPTDDLIAGVE